jgi:hypothetical protein
MGMYLMLRVRIEGYSILNEFLINRIHNLFLTLNHEPYFTSPPTIPPVVTVTVNRVKPANVYFCFVPSYTPLRRIAETHYGEHIR